MILFSKILKYGKKLLVTLIDCFFDDFANWLQKIPELLKNHIVGTLFGCKTFLTKNTNENGCMQEISKNYSKEGEQWHLTTATRDIPETQVPEELKFQKSENELIDVTDELDLSLD